MKKKTSLWISGITTVAMLAVAVGSFAAWNTLTDKTQQFSAKTDTRVELEVDDTISNSVVTDDAAKNIVPKGISTDSTLNTIYDSSKITEEKAVGAFELKRLDSNSDASVSVKADIKVYDDNGTTVNNNFDGTLYKVGANDTDLTKVTGLTNIEKGKYVVKVKFADSVDASTITGGAADALMNKDIKVEVVCTASK